MASKEAYERDRGFFFFRDWVQTIEAIQSTYGAERMNEFVFAIIDYALYEADTDFNDAMVNAAFATIKSDIDASVKKRKSGFTGENQKHKAVENVLRNHTDWSIREVASETGVSKSTVARIKKNIERSKETGGTGGDAGVANPDSSPTPIHNFNLNPTPTPAPIPTVPRDSNGTNGTWDSEGTRDFIGELAAVIEGIPTNSGGYNEHYSDPYEDITL